MGITGTTVLGNANTGTLDLDGNNYDVGAITFGSNYTLNSANTGNLDEIVGDIRFLGNVTVDGNMTIDSNGGDITFDGTVSGTNGDEILTVTDGAGASEKGTINSLEEQSCSYYFINLITLFMTKFFVIVFK